MSDLLHGSLDWVLHKAVWGPGTATSGLRHIVHRKNHSRLWSSQDHVGHHRSSQTRCRCGTPNTPAPALHVGVLGIAAARRMNQSGSQSRRRTAENGQNTEKIRERHIGRDGQSKGRRGGGEGRRPGRKSTDRRREERKRQREEERAGGKLSMIRGDREEEGGRERER